MTMSLPLAIHIHPYHHRHQQRSWQQMTLSRFDYFLSTGLTLVAGSSPGLPTPCLSAAIGAHFVCGGGRPTRHQSELGLALVVFFVQEEYTGALPRPALAESGSHKSIHACIHTFVQNFGG